MDKCGKQLCKDHKINTLITHCALHHCTKHIAHAYTFENELYPAKATKATCGCSRLSHVF